MRLSNSVSLLAAASSLLALVCVLSSCSAKISEQTIHAILDDVDKSLKLKDAEGVVAHLADDVLVKTRIETPGQTYNSNYTRDQFKRSLLQTFNSTPIYDFNRTGRSVVVAADGQTATVTSQTIENVAAGGRVFRNESQETATFEVRQGKILITSIESMGKIVLSGT
jgi:ketosteroid isomerase-like protein